MFGDYKLINSMGKKNLRFVAAGYFQIEFFELHEKEYFAIYQFSGGQGGSRYLVIDLNSASIAALGEDGYQVLSSRGNFKITVSEKRGKSRAYVTRYLWDWLPVSRMGGAVSKTGKALLLSSLAPYAKDLAA